MTAWKITSWVCAATVVLSVICCVAMAIARSNGLVAVTVTALDPADEPRDHNVPLVKRTEALPDYELSLIGDSGKARYLGTKPNQSAADGLKWTLDDELSVSQIAAVRLTEKDQLISDSIAEVQITGDSVESKGYRFDFETSRSMSAGVAAFFRTPIGMAIAAAFGIAVLFLILSILTA